MASTYPTTIDAFTNPSASSLLTSPSHAQQHSDINDAMEAVQTKLAIGNTVLGTYTAYTPTFLNVTAGNGTTSGAYCRVNNFVHYYGSFTLGTTSAVLAGISLGLPINLNSDMSSNFMTHGMCWFYDLSTLVIYQGQTRYNGSVNSVFLNTLNVSATYPTAANSNATIPFTYATGDVINWNIYYRAA